MWTCRIYVAASRSPADTVLFFCRVLLGKIPEQDGKMSYIYDTYVFHYIQEDRLTYMCMGDDQAKRRIPFAFLEDVKNR